jgi:hypothetical protein
MADTPPHPPEAGAGPSTRQLLDELDALMERMLALPVQAAEEPAQAAAVAPPPTPPHSPPTPPPAPVPSRTLTVQAAAPVLQQVVVTRQSAPPPAPLPPPAVPPPPPRQDPPHPDLSAPAYLPVGAEPLLPLILQRPTKQAGKRAVGVDWTPAPRAPAAAPPSPRPAVIKPPEEAKDPEQPSPGLSWLVRVNRAYDRATDLLGGPGRWLRSDQGRNTLGWAGLGMLAAAGLWAALRFLG